MGSGCPYIVVKCLLGRGVSVLNCQGLHPLIKSAQIIILTTIQFENINNCQLQLFPMLSNLEILTHWSISNRPKHMSVHIWLTPNEL